jgi:hypothetical protein
VRRTRSASIALFSYGSQRLAENLRCLDVRRMTMP